MTTLLRLYTILYSFYCIIRNKTVKSNRNLKPMYYNYPYTYSECFLKSQMSYHWPSLWKRNAYAMLYLNKWIFVQLHISQVVDTDWPCRRGSTYDCCMNGCRASYTNVAWTVACGFSTLAPADKYHGSLRLVIKSRVCTSRPLSSIVSSHQPPKLCLTL